MRILAAAIVFAVIGANASWAQNSLPPGLANEIDRAALSTLRPNLAIETAVIEAVAEHPALLDAIIARAVVRDPASKARIVANTSQWFPAFAGRIRQVADGPLPQLPLSTVSAAPVPQLAQSAEPERAPKTPAGRFYLDLDVGAAFSPSSRVSNSTVAGLSGNMSTSTGFVTGGAIGMRLGGGARADFEIAYRRNEIDKINFGAFGLPAAGGSGGDVSSVAFLLNGYFDVPLDSRWTSSFGVGLGGADVSLKVDGSSFDDSAFVFAYQIDTGLAYALTRALSVTAGYKYFATADPKMGANEFEYQTHNLELGLRYSF